MLANAVTLVKNVPFVIADTDDGILMLVNAEQFVNAPQSTWVKAEEVGIAKVFNLLQLLKAEELMVVNAQFAIVILVSWVQLLNALLEIVLNDGADILHVVIHDAFEKAELTILVTEYVFGPNVIDPGIVKIPVAIVVAPLTSAVQGAKVDKEYVTELIVFDQL
jgi:hypothetical protein